MAFQALYSWEIGKESLEDLLKLEWVSEECDQDTRDFARIIIAGTINHIEEIDTLIKAHLSEKWDFNRVNKVSMAILRVSVAQLLFHKDIQPSIVIDEAIGIAREYGADDSFKFINAVLDTINRELQT